MIRYKRRRQITTAPLTSRIAEGPSGAGSASITGTAALAGLAATNATSGSLEFSGTSVLVGWAATNAAAGALEFSGTSVLVGRAGTNAATGSLEFSGTSVLVGQAGTNAATGSLEFSGTSVLVGQAATTATTGSLEFTGTALLVGQAATMAASQPGDFAASGTLVAAAAYLQTNGTVQSGVLPPPNVDNGGSWGRWDGWIFREQPEEKPSKPEPVIGSAALVAVAPSVDAWGWKKQVITGQATAKAPAAVVAINSHIIHNHGSGRIAGSAAWTKARGFVDNQAAHRREEDELAWLLLTA